MGAFEGHLGAALLKAAEAHADRPALWAAGQHYTYGQLLERAVPLALALQDAGVQPGDRVCFLSHRTVTAYASILAILLAGGAYVALNAQYRKDRNQAILDGSGAKALIASAACAADVERYLVSTAADLPILLPEDDSAPPAFGRAVPRNSFPQADAERLAVARPLDDRLPAYLMYTSGSTGVPKGVPIHSANVSAYVAAIAQIGPLTADDRVLQLADLTFDFSVHDIFPSWLAGAEIFSIPENTGPLMPRLIAQHGLTSCAMVPSAAARGLDQGLAKPGKLPTLRQTFFCGEALPTSVARGWQEAGPNGRIINLYGPTEATVALTHYDYVAGRDDDLAIVPIGRPFPDQRVELFDPDLQRVGPGGTGQMLLAGSQVMTGYWQSPELNAERMVEIDGVPWYKTGDLGRVQEPYGLVFAGRADRQVKIRGVLVELQEIEGILRRALAREEVAVLPWPMTTEGSAGGSVAFVCGTEVDGAEIRTTCRAVAEDYLVPERYIFLDALPVNANGKVDYKVLAQHPALAAGA